MRSRFARPLFMDKAYIESSVDSFPIEFLNMKSCHKVVHGEDVLTNLDIRHEHLRLQVERELKGKRLHLMQQWLAARKSAAHLQRLLGLSLADLAPIFRAFLTLRGQTVPADRLSVFSAVDNAAGLGDGVFKRTMEAFLSGNKERIAAVFSEYADAVKKVCGIVDDERKERV